MSISGIQGQLLEVTVVGCNKLKNTEWISRQDPYVCLEYGSIKYRTRTCTDGGKNPTFQEKFVFTLIEGLRELCVVVWNSNTLTLDDFIGNGKIPLQKVLSQGYDDSSYSLQSKNGRYAGEIRLIMHYANAKKPAASHAPPAQSAPSAPPYAGTPPPQVPLYSAPPVSYPPPPVYSSYPPNAGGLYPPPPQPLHHNQPAPYPPTYPHPPPDPYYCPPGSYAPSPYPPHPF